MDDFQYIRGDKMILPYLPSVLEFKEDTLVGIYNRLKEEDLYKVVFHGNPTMDLSQFISFFSSPNVALSFFCVIVDGVEYPAGMCWLTDILTADGTIKTANGNFVFFKEYQKPSYTNEFGKIALDFWLNRLKLNVVVGMTPSDNRAALLYIKRLGFKEVGRIPNYAVLFGYVCDGVITYIDQKLYNERYENGR
jgi:RimJ/RimL family protein N-acetyltransferase